MNDAKHDLCKQTYVAHSPTLLCVCFWLQKIIGTVSKVSTRCQAHFLDWFMVFLRWGVENIK